MESLYVYNSQDAVNLYRYVHIFTTGNNNYFGKLYAYSGSTTTSNLVICTDYTIDSDPTSGNTRIKNLKSSTIQGNFNNLAIIWNELGRRLCPVIRDANTIKFDH